MRTLITCMALALLTLAVYWRATGFGFVALDDQDNIVKSPHVPQGVTLRGVFWAFTTDYPDYWHPMTTLSWMLDTDLYGGPPPKAEGFHITSLALHIINSLLALLVFWRLTGRYWPSAALAAWFALHPMRVESVVWITERKDVLSALFWLLTMWAYGEYARGGRWTWYLLAMVWLALGLMSKPMLVTLPAALLLLDYWPLRRLAWTGDWKAFARHSVRLIVEKIPFLVLIAGSCVITYLHGSKAAADISLRLRLANAIVAYVRYIGKMFWPADMAVYYSYPGMFGADPWALWQVIASLALLALITLAALLLLRKQPYFIVGWLWFVGTLAPVIGILQVGNQSIADRFTYIPYVGLFIIVAWWMADLWRHRAWRVALTSIVTLSLIACVILTRRQVEVWKDSDSLYSHALAVTDHNGRVHNFYGSYLLSQNRLDEAEPHLRIAVELCATDSRVANNYGYLLLKQRRYFEAAEMFRKAVELDPEYAVAHYNLGYTLSQRGDHEGAIEELNRAIELGADSPDLENYRAELRRAEAARSGR